MYRPPDPPPVFMLMPPVSTAMAAPRPRATTTVTAIVLRELVVPQVLPVLAYIPHNAQSRALTHKPHRIQSRGRRLKTEARCGLRDKADMHCVVLGCSSPQSTTALQ